MSQNTKKERKPRLDKLFRAHNREKAQNKNIATILSLKTVSNSFSILGWTEIVPVGDIGWMYHIVACVSPNRHRMAI